MDPYASLNLETETSLLLMTELKAQGHRVYWTEMDRLYLDNGKLRGRVSEVEGISPFNLGEDEDRALEELDALINRKEPPFDLNYLHLSLLFDFLPKGFPQINAPKALRDLNEKLASQRFPSRTTDCRVSMNPKHLAEFASKMERVVVKPLDDCSGRGIVMLKGNDPDLEAKLTARMPPGGQFLMVQRHLPLVHKGDKRVFLAGGQVCGIVNRVPKDEDSLGNIHMGARCELATLTPREEETLRQIVPLLEAEGVLLAGVDFIGEELTEINLTSPSAMRQINEVSGGQREKEVVGAILRFIKSRQA